MRINIILPLAAFQFSGISQSETLTLRKYHWLQVYFGRLASFLQALFPLLELHWETILASHGMSMKSHCYYCRKSYRLEHRLFA